jgi:predicted GIY-YIG superfamily endonuclease
MPFWLYILRLKSGSLYVGATTNLKKRYGDHCSGKACRTTKFDPPVDIVYTETFESLSGARNRESQVKRWSRAKKEALIAGNIVKLKELAKLREK